MIVGWLRHYQKAWLRADVIAGLTATAVVVPKAMAYATIAGLPVQAGLYTALVPMLIYAALGTSRTLSVSTTTTIAILVGAELEEVLPRGEPSELLAASAMLALLVGGVLLVAWLLRLGFVANFISEPVLIGFKAGIGLVIVLDQLPKLLGVHIEKGSFAHNLAATAGALPDTSIIILAVGASTMLLLMALERLVPSIPAPLVAVAGGIIAVYALGLEGRGVAVVGQIPSGLPSLVVPNWSLVGKLWMGALAVALMSFTETVAVGRAFAEEGEPPIDAGRELLATGFAAAGGAFFGAMACGGGMSQTAVNSRAGAKSQLAEVVTVGATLLIVLFLARPMGRMPQATLAAVVVFYSVSLISPSGFRDILAVRRLEFWWALAAVIGVMLLGTLEGILAAILISLLALAQQVASPPAYVLGRKRGTSVFRPISESHPDDETFPGLLIVRVDGRIFFVNAAGIGARIRRLAEEAGASTLAIDLSGVFDLEYTALGALIEGEKRLRSEGISIWLVGLTPPVLDVVRRSSLGSTLGRERMYFTLDKAVRAYLEQERTLSSS